MMAEVFGGQNGFVYNCIVVKLVYQINFNGEKSMRVLTFKTEYLDMIEKGKKIQTIRFWKKSPIGRVGEVITATNFRKKLRLRLVSLESKKVRQLTMEEARLDGFNSLGELRRALTSIYTVDSKKMLEKKCIVIRFEKI